MKANLASKHGRKIYRKWLFQDDDMKINLEWAPLTYLLYFPSVKKVEAQFDQLPKTFVHHRKPVEFTEEISTKPANVFPSCKNNEGARFLGESFLTMNYLTNNMLLQAKWRLLLPSPMKRLVGVTRGCCGIMCTTCAQCSTLLQES